MFGWRRSQRMAARILFCNTLRSGGHKPRRTCCFSQAQSLSSGVQLRGVGGEAKHTKAGAVMSSYLRRGL